MSQGDAVEERAEQHLRMLRAVELAAERLLADPFWETSLQQVLQALAEATGTRRAHFLTEYEILGLAPPQSAAVAETPAEGQHWLFQPRLGTLQTGSLDQLPAAFAESLDFPRQGSYALLPLAELGYLCLESTELHRPWPQHQIELLQTTGRMLGATLLRRRAEHLLMQREERFRTLLDSVSDPIAGFDPNDRFCFVNRAFTDLLGYSLATVSDLRLTDLVQADDRPCLEELIALQHQPASPPPDDTPTLNFVTAEGNPLPLECHLERTPRDVDGVTYRGIFHDRRHERLVQNLQRQFVSLVHHELKTPLTSIVGAVRLLEAEDGLKRPEAPRLLDILHRNTNHLEQLIGKLLDLQHLSLGQTSYEIKAIEARPLLDTVAEAWRKTADAKANKIRISGDSGLYAQADSQKLFRAIEELLEMACRFAWTGSEVHLALESQNNDLRLSVSHQGPGLPSGVLDDLYLGVSQEEADTMHPGQRIGIGLTLAKQLVEGMAGRLEIHNRQGEGVRITIQLPQAFPNTAPSPGDSP